MKKILVLLMFTFGYFIQSEAQTKLIAHKSHSGSLANFKTALEGDLFDMGLSDFGEPAWTEEKHRLDSLVKIDEHTVEMHVTHFCNRWGSQSDTLEVCDIYNRRMDGTVFSTATYKDEVLELLAQNSSFDYPLENVKLIGYLDKKEEKTKDIPSNDPNVVTPIVEKEKVVTPAPKPTKKELRKKKKAAKKADKKARELGEIKEEEKPKVCTKPKIEIPVFLDDLETNDTEPSFTEKPNRYEWLVMAGLTLFSILIGVFAQFLRSR